MIRFEIITEERGYKVALPSTMRKALTAAHYKLTKDGNMAIADYLLKAIIRRAPFETGFLKRSIKARLVRQTRKNNVMEILSTAPYAFDQEFGYIHPTAIPIDYILQHLRNPGIRGQPVDNVWAWVYPTKYTPFVRPAHIYLMRNIGNIWKSKWYSEMVRQGTIYKRIKVL